MKIKLHILIAILISSFTNSCKNKTNHEHLENGYSGVYHFTQDKGKKLIRGWNKKYWQLDLFNNKGTLSYFENARGINDFHISVTTKNHNDTINVYFDSIITTAYFPPSEIFNKKTDDLIIQLIRNNDTLQSNSSFLNITSSNAHNLQKFVKTNDKTEFYIKQNYDSTISDKIINSLKHEIDSWDNWQGEDLIIKVHNFSDSLESLTLVKGYFLGNENDTSDGYIEYQNKRLIFYKLDSLSFTLIDSSLLIKNPKKNLFIEGVGNHNPRYNYIYINLDSSITVK